LTELIHNLVHELLTILYMATDYDLMYIWWKNRGI